VRELRPDVLFARRLEEARRAHQLLLDLVGALAEALFADARIEVPPFVFRDEETGELALAWPEPKAPVPHFEVESVLGDGPSAERRLVSCTYKMRAGIKVNFHDGRWRVIRVDDGDGSDRPARRLRPCRRRSVLDPADPTRPDPRPDRDGVPDREAIDRERRH